MSGNWAREREQTTLSLDPLGDLVDCLEVALRGDGEAGLDDVDAHLLQDLGDLDFFRDGHGGARRLLAIAKRGVEHHDLLRRGLGCFRSRRDLGFFRCWIAHSLIGRHGSKSFLRTVGVRQA